MDVHIFYILIGPYTLLLYDVLLDPIMYFYLYFIYLLLVIGPYDAGYSGCTRTSYVHFNAQIKFGNALQSSPNCIEPNNNELYMHRSPDKNMLNVT